MRNVNRAADCMCVCVSARVCVACECVQAVVTLLRKRGSRADKGRRHRVVGWHLFFFCCVVLKIMVRSSSSSSPTGVARARKRTTQLEAREQQQKVRRRRRRQDPHPATTSPEESVRVGGGGGLCTTARGVWREHDRGGLHFVRGGCDSRTPVPQRVPVDD